MEYVLGLSLTPSAVRWVLVEGDEGEPVDRGVLDGDAVRTSAPDDIVDALLGEPAVADREIRAVGVTAAAGSEATARALVWALSARGFDGVAAISDLEAVDALACGIVDMAGFDGVAVCVVDDGGAVVGVVDSGGVTVERVARNSGGSLDKFVDALRAKWSNEVCQPDAVFVLGAGDLESLVAALEDGSSVPVSTADEADLAMARGAALASADVVDTTADDDERPSKWEVLQGNSRIVTLASVLVAASVTLVVSASVAVSLQLGPGDDPEPVQRPVAEAVQQSAPKAKPPAPLPTAAPRSIAALTPAAEVPAAPPEALESVAAAAPPIPEALPEPVDEPPAYVPPTPDVPAYVPPAPDVPAYVPPNTLPGPAVAQQVTPPEAQQIVPQPVPPVPEKPRLRDRIIDKIPLINRIGD